MDNILLLASRVLQVDVEAAQSNTWRINIRLVDSIRFRVFVLRLALCVSDASG